MKRTTIHDGPRFRLERLEYTAPGGSAQVRDIVRHPGAVVIVPILDPRTLALIRNRRVAVGTTLWELPAGTLEPREAPAQCAQRELEEETGYRAGRIVPLGWFYTTPGLTDERMHAFAALDLTPVGQSLDDGEEIEVRTIDAAEAIRMIDDGELVDAKSMLALLTAARRGLLDVRLEGGATA